ncbi:flavodoxin domain-containing protein [Pontibacter sp. JAM-7]|uniref:flavodoxin domain-containing protein n=1 Tax=Pontibacter sp. JAM-7 TaxID=3366581 RepID=UPI003AF62F3B
MANIKLMIGTVYGNAEEVAVACAENLNAAGHQVALLRRPELSDLLAADTDVLLFCSSTTGQGELPDEMLHLYLQMKDACPPLPQLRYGLIGLGDSGYEEFAGGPKMLNELLFELQLKCVGIPLYIDACDTMDPVAAALTWLDAWQQQL